MSFTPLVKEFNAQQQGNQNFPYPSDWNDVKQVSTSAVSYDLTAARTAMGLPAGLPLLIIFSADGPFWVNFNATAALPSADTTNGTSSEFSPNQRYVDSRYTAISFIAPAACNVSMQFYRP